jgi:hypothetical protein
MQGKMKFKTKDQAMNEEMTSTKKFFFSPLD